MTNKDMNMDAQQHATYSKKLPLSDAFKQLDACLYVDPEDLDEEEVERLFQIAIKQHDYWYDRSDDLRVFDKGQAEYGIITEHTSRAKNLHEIWVKFCAEKDKR